MRTARVEPLVVDGAAQRVERGEVARVVAGERADGHPVDQRIDRGALVDRDRRPQLDGHAARAARVEPEPLGELLRDRVHLVAPAPSHVPPVQRDADRRPCARRRSPGRPRLGSRPPPRRPPARNGSDRGSTVTLAVERRARARTDPAYARPGTGTCSARKSTGRPLTMPTQPITSTRPRSTSIAAVSGTRVFRSFDDRRERSVVSRRGSPSPGVAAPSSSTVASTSSTVRRYRDMDAKARRA